jgi:Na+/H+-translocating membrane pyrophosphatase
MLIGVAIVSTTIAVIMTIGAGGYKNINTVLNASQTSDSDKGSSPKVVGSHTPGYPIATTSGNILDPFKQQKMEIHAMPSLIL